VHYAGHPVPMDILSPWAKEKGLKVIEDCAHTAGGVYKGKVLGTWEISDALVLRKEMHDNRRWRNDGN